MYYKRSFSSIKWHILLLSFSVCLIVAIASTLSEISINSQTMENTASNYLNEVVADYKYKLDQTGAYIAENGLAQECSSIYKLIELTRGIPPKIHSMPRIPPSLINMGWHGIQQTCSANPLGFSEIKSNESLERYEEILTHPGANQIKMDYEEILEQKIMTISKSILNKNNQVEGIIYLQVSANDFLRFLNNIIPKKSDLIQLDVKFVENKPILTKRINSSAFSLYSLKYLLILYIPVILIISFLNIRSLRISESKYWEHLQTSKRIAEAEQLQRELDCKVQNNVNSHLKKLNELIDEIDTEQYTLISTTIKSLTQNMIMPSQYSFINLEDSLNTAIALNMDDAAKHKITFKCDSLNNLNISTDELKFILILSGIVRYMTFSSEEDSNIEIRTMQDNSSIIILLHEPNGYPRTLDSKEILEHIGSPSRSKPNWATTKNLIDSEGYDISSTHSADIGFILILKIPHTEVQNVLRFK